MVQESASGAVFVHSLFDWAVTFGQLKRNWWMASTPRAVNRYPPSHNLSPVGEAREKMGPDQVLAGNIDPIRVLLNGAPHANVRALVEEPGSPVQSVSVWTMVMQRAGFAVLLLIALSLGRAAEPNRLTDAERQQGWRLLFDGKSTAGWEEITGKQFPTDCWIIEDSSLKVVVRSGGFQDIRTRGSFGSFDLQFDWKVLKEGNSGVKYLIQRVDEWTNAAGRQARARGLE